MCILLIFECAEYKTTYFDKDSENNVMVSKRVDDFDNPVLADAVKFWSEKHPSYKHVFQKLHSLLRIVDLIAIEDETDEVIISDFVTGLVLLAHKDEVKDGNLTIKPDMNHYTKPMMDIVIAFIKSDSFNESTIKHYIPGDEKLLIDGLVVPVTTEKIINFWKLESQPIFDLNDAQSVYDDYIEYRKGNRKIKPKAGKTKEGSKLTLEIRPKEKRQEIEKYFNLYEHGLFVRNKDQEFFIDILIDYYVKYNEGMINELVMPSQIIELKRLTKTKAANILSPIYSVINNTDQLKHNKEFLAIVRLLSHFSYMDDHDIYDNISKNPRYIY